MAEIDLAPAIDAAARQMAYLAEEEALGKVLSWDAATDSYREVFRVSAREVIRDALPHIERAVRQQIAQEIEAVRSDPDSWPPDAQDGFLQWQHGLDAAAAIARSEAGGS